VEVLEEFERREDPCDDFREYFQTCTRERCGGMCELCAGPDATECITCKKDSYKAVSVVELGTCMGISEAMQSFNGNASAVASTVMTTVVVAQTGMSIVGLFSQAAGASSVLNVVGFVSKMQVIGNM
jgi:hypothetical protein